MEPNLHLHLHLHRARVDASLRRHHLLQAQRPRPPGAGRNLAARGLRRLADRLEAPAPAAHA